MPSACPVVDNISRRLHWIIVKMAIVRTAMGDPSWVGKWISDE
jgi:hypothetical protein